MSLLAQDKRSGDESLFRNIVAHASDGIVVANGEGCVEYCNPAFARLFQRSRDELQGGLFGYPIVAGESTEINILRKDGTLAVAEMRVSQTRLGDSTAFVAMLRDITERKEVELALRLSNQIFENTQEGIVVTDDQGIIRTVNRAFSAVTGYSPAEAIGRKPSLLKSGRHGPSFYDKMWCALADEGQWRGEIWNRRKNGEIYPEWININTIRDKDGVVSHYVAIFSDITKIKEDEEKLRTLAHFDRLTGLPNRFLFQNHVELALAQAARNGRQVAIMFLDLDRFKLINDSLGHSAGDTVLAEVARRLSACLRGSDTLCRFGGDEFNAVLPYLENATAAASVAEKFIEVLAAPFCIEGEELRVTTSIGIALYPQHGADLEQLSRAADAAMYQVKKDGRNAYRFCDSDDHGTDRPPLVQTLSRRDFGQAEQGGPR